MINTWIHNALKKLASFFTRVSLKQEQVSKTAVLLNASRLNVSKRSLYTSQVTSSTGIDLKHEATVLVLLLRFWDRLLSWLLRNKSVQLCHCINERT